MSANFRMKLKKQKHNLHIKLSGDFDGSSACELLNQLNENPAKDVCIFIDTNGLRDITPFGCLMFRDRINTRRLPSNRLFFEGAPGLELAPDGYKVTGYASKTPKESHACQCNGNCKNCPCSGKGDNHH